VNTLKRIAHRLHDLALGVVLIIAALCYGMNGAELVEDERE